ncbi:ABC transporter permease [Vibrio ponticus]|uniref:ABC transporter permease n=1 Tax=Vibrio ponticus TaxID=265668 RepID=A0A3N3DY48_9VIBR|nr:ABC transporter permease [Vibrio ponticus]ROV59465.1 ABC transporter permease [Vibrio ponticus]
MSFQQNANAISQWQIVRRDRWLLSCLTWLPIALAISIWAIFSQGIARDLPIAVVDLSHSEMSRTLSRYYDATSSMAVVEQMQSANQAEQALISGDIYAYAVIPLNFEEDVYKGLNPQVSVFYNSQFILIGKLINSAFVQAQGTFNAQIATIANLAHGNQTLSSAMGQALPIRTQITPLFNKNSNYAQFLVSAIIPALWQIVVVVSTILILAANHRQQGLSKWLAEQPIKRLVVTLSPYLPVFALQGFAFLCWFYLGFKWPMEGSLLILVIGQWVTVIACMIMGSFFFFMTLDPARAMSFAGAFTAPSFAFMGITFPVTDMNTLAQFWRSLLPISHYIELQVSQVSYGASWHVSIQELLPMLGYLLPLLLTGLLIKKHLTAAAIPATEKQEHQ